MRFLSRLALIGSLACAAVSPMRAAETAVAKPPPRKVELGLYILDVADIDEPAGRFTVQVLLSTAWTDPARAFAGTEPHIFREDAAVDEVNTGWRPMAEFNRSAAPADLNHSLLKVFPDGRVEFERQMNVTLTAQLDLRRLPFDTQNLQIELESFQHQADAMEFTLPPGNLRMTQRISLQQWEPVKLSAQVAPVFRDVYQETYSRATVTIAVKRHFHFYLWQMIVPLVIVLAMAFAVFFLPPEDLSDRMSVIIASLLTVVALSYSLHSGLPKIPYLTIIDWLFVLAYVFLGLAMAGMVFIGSLHRRDEAQAIRFDRWLRWVYPLAYVLVAGAVIVTAL
ncbi:MAG TPA: hypothetical protein VG838_14525 [Opitutaceae bacterium]|nr:hypothetical protein [Opitutaceae bacterium]HWB95762.1 hypothetical protein [Bryobacteraceae bacterium]